MRLVRTGCWSGMLSVLLALVGPAGAEEPVPIEAFFRDARIRDPKISPGGKRLAGFITTARGFAAIVHYDLATGEMSPVSGFTKPVSRFWWANDDRLLFNALSRGGYDRKLRATDVGGKKFFDFSRQRNPKAPPPIAARQQYADLIVDTLPSDPRHVLIEYREPAVGDVVRRGVYRLNVYTGRERKLLSSPEKIRTWYTDKEGRVLVGEGRRSDDGYFVHRVSEKGDWVRFEAPDGVDGFTLLGNAAGDTQLYVSARVDSDMAGVFIYDVVEQRFSPPLFRHEEYDVDGAHIVGDQILGVTYTDHYHRTEWLDKYWARAMATVRAALPGKIIQVLDFTSDGRMAVMLAGGDRDPGGYYVYHPERRELKVIAERLPEIEPASMSPVSALSYAARDGVVIAAYITMPRGVEPSKLPLVVMPHGGPWQRDSAMFDPISQFLANRGWAVFRPNFRGSTGYGRKFSEAGWGEWGLRMQDDITDGVRWLIDEGIADPERICIVGWSYGGYAALVGAFKTPELYQCAGSIAGISDLVELRRDKEWYMYDGTWDKLLGDKRRDHDKLEASSPIENVERIRAPIFLAHGKEDRLFRVNQTTRMARALRKAGKEHEVFLIDDAAHSYTSIRERDRIELFRRLEAFLNKHLGGASLPTVAAPGS